MRINAVGSLSLEYQIGLNNNKHISSNGSLEEVAKINKIASDKVAGLHNSEARTSQFMIANDSGRDLIRGNYFEAYA